MAPTPMEERVLSLIRGDLPEGIDARWEEPVAARATAPRQIPLAAILSLLRLCPGSWLRLGPTLSGSYHAQARKSGCEVTSRVVDGKQYLFMRSPASA